jgi:hypothetical protein
MPVELTHSIFDYFINVCALKMSGLPSLSDDADPFLYPRSINLGRCSVVCPSLFVQERRTIFRYQANIPVLSLSGVERDVDEKLSL